MSIKNRHLGGSFGLNQLEFKLDTEQGLFNVFIGHCDREYGITIKDIETENNIWCLDKPQLEEFLLLLWIHHFLKKYRILFLD